MRDFNLDKTLFTCLLLIVGGTFGWVLHGGGRIPSSISKTIGTKKRPKRRPKGRRATVAPVGARRVCPSTHVYLSHGVCIHKSKADWL